MRTVVKVAAGVVLLVLLGSAVAAGMFWRTLEQPYKGYDTEQFIEVPAGASTASIGRDLVQRGIVRDALTFRAALLLSGQAESLKAGEYPFGEPLTARQVIDRLARGEIYTRRITFPEGLTAAEMAALYERGEFGTAAGFLAAVKNESLIEDLDPSAPDLEGYLFPETYDIARGSTADALVRRMVERFKLTFDDALRKSAAEQGLTVREVVTLAALVEKETGHPDERPIVAGVYRNRLRIGMPMQADPTLIYALQKAGRYDGNIRRADLDFDSPYNTYRYPGLPPGPIASPGKASLEAALRPADVKHLYFVSRNDGTHVFADTLAQHNANVQKFQIQYFREKRREGK